MAPIAHCAEDRTPMKSLPSPTLTNPDMVLPNESRRFPMWSSPPRNTHRDRPPSPSYLRDRSGEIPIIHNANAVQPAPQGKREKRGLMSRKMMLLRSRTASNGYERQANGHTTPTQEEHSYRQPPELMDVGNLAPPEQPESAWSNDESSAGSDDMAGLPQFLAKYNNGNEHTSGTDDELDGSTAVGHYDQPPSTFGGSEDAERRQKEKDEQNSAILSKRAEEILANAKKRLNLMEGNLRGARDLVAPLTAANLKRATSVASYVPPINNYGGINRYVEGNYRYDATTKQSYRPLHAQASNPVIGRDYQGHWRGFSDVQISDRPSSALDRVSTPVNTRPHIPVRVAESPLTAKPLKGSRSYDSLALRQQGSRDVFYSRNSPEQNLEPLVEDDDPEYVEAPRKSTSSRADSREGSRRGVNTPEDLHEQMSSLKGRISALKERAREDSVRRQSMQNLREPSPLNNATSTAPEFFYQSSPTYGSPVLDTRAGVGHTNPHSPDVDSAPSPISKTLPVVTGSRNAFAEQARRQQQKKQHAPTSSTDSSSPAALWGIAHIRPQPTTSHTRTPSGTAIVQSSKHRYSHHQYNSSNGSADAFVATNGASTAFKDTAIGTAHDGSSRYGDDERSEVGGAKSIYEDAQPEPPPAIVAHEDREDAFDYENFFLHSAMSYYANDASRRPSTSAASDEHSTDSMSTARGPAAVDVLAGYVDFDSDRDSYTNGYTPGPEPQTPEKLREIERNLHRRTFSDESIESITSFATATEGLESPDRTSAMSSSIPSTVSSAHISTAMEWPVPPVDLASVGGNTPRPDNPGVIPAKAREIQISSPSGDSSSSERADSGLGLGLSGVSKDGSIRRGQNQSQQTTPPSASAPSQQTHKPSFSSSAAPNVTSLSPLWMNSPPLSPPNSPRSQDPATVAVNALLIPGGRQLGLRDKALMFGLVESLKQVCRQLQEGDEAGLENRMLRRRLDDARRVLAGGSEVRPGTS